MRFICDIHSDEHHLKIAFSDKNIVVNNHVYKSSYHLSQPQFLIHNDLSHENIIFNIKPFQDINFIGGSALFYQYDQEADLFKHYKTAYIHQNIKLNHVCKIICQTPKILLRRKIGRLYSDIL